MSLLFVAYFWLWVKWASIDHRCQKEWLALFASLFRINCNPVFCSIFPLCFEPCVYFWPGVRLFSAASIFCVCWSMCALVTGVCVNGRPFLHILFPPHLNDPLDSLLARTIHFIFPKTHHSVTSEIGRLLRKTPGFSHYGLFPLLEILLTT